MTLSVLSRPEIAVLMATGFAALLSFLISLVLVRTRRWHGHLTLDDTTGVQKFHKGETPRVGGIAIFVTLLCVLALLPAPVARMGALILLAGVPAFVAGIWEDLRRNVGVRYRLLATMSSGVLFALLTGYTMHRVDVPGVDWLLGYWAIAVAFTGFAVGGVANAINIIDGFNGLASGALILMFLTFAAVAHLVGDGLTMALALVFAGLVLGFFLVNFPHGPLFFGDGGAYFCGYLLAVLGVLLPMRNPEISAWGAILICGYPVIETLASMWRKHRRAGHSVGQPDGVHFHMLAHRRYGRRLARTRAELRNPATSVASWGLVALTSIFALISYDSAFLSAGFFFVTVYVYSQVYRIMSFNPHGLPAAIARLL